MAFAQDVTIPTQDYQRIIFHSIAKGQGIILWGQSAFPTEEGGTYTYGELEYQANLTRSIFVLTGFSRDISGDDSSVLWLRNIKASGVIAAKWANNDEHHKLIIKLKSGLETEGALIREEAQRTLLVGLDIDIGTGNLEKLFNPKYATMTFKGTFDGEKITGIIYACMATMYDGDQEYNIVIVNFYIYELCKYVCLAWGFAPGEESMVRFFIKLM